MKKYLVRFRHYLELIALPAFAYLVVHMSGHGIALLAGEEHDHAHEAGHGILESILTVEVLSGILLLLAFVWIWHRPFMRKFVPCAHDHCTHKHFWPHIFATSAFVLHFFPEAGVRSALFESFDVSTFMSVAGLIAFTAHFLVDVIIAIMLSSFWGKKGFAVSMVLISVLWVSALLVGHEAEEFLPIFAEGAVFLMGGFLLSMFIHKPHLRRY